MPTAWLPWPGKIKAMPIKRGHFDVVKDAAKTLFQSFLSSGARRALEPLARQAAKAREPQEIEDKGTSREFPHARTRPCRQNLNKTSRESFMKRPIIIGALVASAAVTSASFSLVAAEPETWPWKSKLPPNPALVELSSVDGVSVVINKSDQ